MMLEIGTIGGSQIAAIVGLSPHRTRFEVWLDIIGQTSERPDEDCLRWGRIHEPQIAAEYERRHWETDGAVPIESHVVHHRQHTWARASPDRLIRGERRGLEIKTAGYHDRHRWGPDGSDVYPVEYALQCQWYLEVLDYDRWDLAVLIGGSDYREYQILRDCELGSYLLGCADLFMREHVIPQIPPPVEASESYSDWLLRQHQKSSDEMAESTAETDAIAERLRDARERRIAAEADELLAENEIKAAIGSNRGIKGSWGRATWSTVVKKAGVDWEAIARGVLSGDRLEEEIARHLKPAPVIRAFRPTFTKGDHSG